MTTYAIKPLAFIWRDFINEASYKFAFSLQFFGIIISALSCYFLSRLFGDANIPFLKPYGGNYFAFVIIGVAFFSYLDVAISGLSKTIREGQTLGTLEALLVTQTDISTIIISSSLYSFILATVRIGIYLVFSVMVFGLRIGQANVVSALIMLILTVISFSSLGIISASFIMVLKRGDPITWVITGTSALLGGVYYPISVLPDWLQFVSHLLPITYSLEGLRMAILQGYTLGELLPNIVALLVFSIIMLPLSFTIFNYAIKIAKRDGSLAQY